MNKYIYKVKFVTLYNKNMHKHELIFGNGFNNRKIDWKQEKYECFMSILKNMPFFNFGS